MILLSHAVPPFMKNGFVVGCERTRDAAIIDPGDEVDELLALVDRQALRLTSILLTHAHFDHVTGVARVKARYGIPIYLHADDMPFYDHAPEQGRMFGLDVDQPPPVDHTYGAQPLTIGDHVVRVHHTPGHCPGGVCLEIGDTRDQGNAGDARHLFVGDTLFAGSIGRTDLPGGDYQVLMRSITEVLMPFGDEAIVHPGHGPDTTIGRERRTNPFVLEYLAAR